MSDQWTVRLNAGGQIEVVEVPETEYLYQAAAQLVRAQWIEPVYAIGLRVLGMVLLVDENGIANKRDGNSLASYLYGSECTFDAVSVRRASVAGVMGQPAIVGDAVVARDVWTAGGPDFGWLSEASARALCARLRAMFGADS